MDPLIKAKNDIVLIDCGANKGEFSEYLNSNFGAKCYGFEPDPRLYLSLKNDQNITYYQKAVGSKDGLANLNLGEKHCSSLKYKESDVQSYAEVEVVELERFCTNLGIQSIGLLKIDIEGAELDLLEGLTRGFLSKVDQITVEFHDFLDKRDIPRIKSVIRKMENQGFYVLKLSFFTYGDVLMINHHRIRLSTVQKLFFVINKYVVGIRRFLMKLV